MDECAGPALARWLEGQGHVVFSIFDEARGLDDLAIIRKAIADKWIIVTTDKDFGTMIFRDGYPHHGVILLRLEDEQSSTKIAVIERFIAQFGNQLSGNYVVVTEEKTRFARR